MIRKAQENSRYMQYICALTGTLPVSAAVTYVTWSSPTLPKLTSDNSPIGIKLTADEVSWIASSFLLGGTIGGLIAGWLIDRGRKQALVLSAIFLFLPWIGIIFARSAWTICIARFIAGIASTIGASIYNGEIAENDIRGKLGTTLQLMNILGGLFVLCIGPFVSYTVLAICCCTIPVVFVIIFYSMPESPYFLIKSNREIEAKVNLTRLCAKNVEPGFINTRLKEISDAVHFDMRNKLPFWKIFTRIEYRKSLLIMVGKYKTTNTIADIIANIRSSSTKNN